MLQSKAHYYFRATECHRGKKAYVGPEINIREEQILVEVLAR